MTECVRVAAGIFLRGKDPFICVLLSSHCIAPERLLWRRLSGWAREHLGRVLFLYGSQTGAAKSVSEVRERIVLANLIEFGTGASHLCFLLTGGASCPGFVRGIEATWFPVSSGSLE